MAETLDDGVLRHFIDLRHLINDGEKSWFKFQLVGLSGRDGFVYLVAYKEDMDLPEIGIFCGSPLLPNSWKLISRFSVSRFLQHLGPNTMCCAAFSNDLTQIGIIVRGKFIHQPDVPIGYCFVLFDLITSQWKDRPFLWQDQPAEYFYYRFSHTCAGWILYPDFIADHFRTVFRFSLDPAKECIANLLQFAQEIVNSDQSFAVYVSNDNLYCFCYGHHHRFMYIFYLNRDGFPWDRYMIDSDGYHLLHNCSGFTKKFINNALLFKALTCTRTSDDQPCSDPNQEAPFSHHFCPIYSVILDSDAKCCRVEKIGQFMDRAALVRLSIDNYDHFMVYEIVSGMLTKSKRIAIFDGLRVDQDIPTLNLETVFFKPPTLKELCSVTLVKALCQKTNHVVQLRDEAGSFSVDTWSGGPSEEVYGELGLNMPTLNFGQMEP